MLLVMLVLSAWLAYHANRAARQKRAVEILRARGALIPYGYELSDGQGMPTQWVETPRTTAPEWLVERLGIDWFYEVESAYLLPNVAQPDELEGPITDANLARLRNLPGLKTLHVSSYEITDRGLAHIAHLDGLEELVLVAPKVTEEGLAHIAKLANLRTLEFSGSQHISDVGLDHICKLRALRRLTIVTGQLKEASLSRLDVLPHLEDVAILGPPISDADVQEISQVRKLKRLSLMHCFELTDNGISHLTNLENLEQLRIWSPLVSADGYLRLAALPKLTRLELGDADRQMQILVGRLGPSKLTVSNVSGRDVYRSIVSEIQTAARMAQQQSLDVEAAP